MKRLFRFLPAATLIALSVVLLEAAASYPTSVKSFTTKVPGDTVQPSHVNDLQDEVTAIETDLLAAWTPVVYNAANFTAATGTWTVDAGDAVSVAYKKIGKTLIIGFRVDTTDVSATPTELYIAIPGGYLANRPAIALVQVSNAGGAFAAGVARVEVGDAVIRFQSTAAGAAWSTTSSDNTYVRGQIVIEVQ
jgi:hypothetical protein